MSFLAAVAGSTVFASGVMVQTERIKQPLITPTKLVVYSSIRSPDSPETKQKKEQDLYKENLRH